jgi:hypothetical protein
MKKFNLKEHIAKNKATFYSSLQENESTKKISLETVGIIELDPKIQRNAYNKLKSMGVEIEIDGEVDENFYGDVDYESGLNKLQKRNTNMKESKLRSKIKEMILAELAESNIDINDTTGEYDFLAEEDYDRDRDAKAMGYRNAEEADEDNWGLPKDNEENPEASLNEEDYDRDRDAKAMGYRNAEEADEDNWGLPKDNEENPEASLNEEEEEEEVEVEDTEETEDVEVNTDEVDPTIKAVQDALAQAQAAAQKLGDEKLTDQIGNTITFFTRAHVSNPQQNNLMENNQPLFPMLKKILK